MPERVISIVPQDNLVRLTHIIYALHALSVIIGFIGSAFIITTFLTGWPSIIAVIVNYTKRGAVRGTHLDSHFGWQIRTFWYALLWVTIAAILFITVIGIVFAYIIIVGAGIWVSYRIIRGWVALNEGRSMPTI
ncbi:MAG: hypothetical protein E4H07_02735 [Nitrosomonadales bacterium]|jgi:uncharacterized membrane protein|nr:MAG: hypothetical protein E4H07_02735 [Nitrosomonadales bacterium]